MTASIISLSSRKPVIALDGTALMNASFGRISDMLGKWGYALRPGRRSGFVISSKNGIAARLFADANGWNMMVEDPKAQVLGEVMKSFKA